MTNEPVFSGQQAEVQRERVIEVLTEHFAHDNLSMEEFEQRLDRVYAASTSSALTAVLADLPALESQPTSVAGTQPAPPVHAEEGYGWRMLIAIMSGVRRRGEWTSPGNLHAIAFMGGVELDFRSARLTSQVTDVNVFAMMGGVEITVPPGVRVEASGFAIMGGFDDTHTHAATTDPNAPVIRIRGLAIMGGVEVRVLEPGAKKGSSATTPAYRAERPQG